MTAKVYRTPEDMPKRNLFQYGGLICMQLLGLNNHYILDTLPIKPPWFYCIWQNKRVQCSAHFIPYFTKDKGNLHHLGPCTSLVQGHHWLFWALWKNIGKDWPHYYHLHPGHEEHCFWVSSSDGFGQNSGVPTSHNGSEWMRHSACGSCWGQSSDSNSYVSPTSPGMLWRWDAWGEPVFHSWRSKSSSPVGFSTCENGHKLCALCWEWLNILWHCTTETQLSWVWCNSCLF